jgi:hypothetical protein
MFFHKRLPWCTNLAPMTQRLNFATWPIHE